MQLVKLRVANCGSDFSHLSCGSGGTGRRTILRGWRRKAWGFESPLPHHFIAFTFTLYLNLVNDLAG